MCFLSNTNTPFAFTWSVYRKEFYEFLSHFAGRDDITRKDQEKRWSNPIVYSLNEYPLELIFQTEAVEQPLSLFSFSFSYPYQNVYYNNDDQMMNM